MGYLEFVCAVADESREALARRLMDLGSTGIVEQDGTLVAYFDDRCGRQWIADQLSSFRETLRSAGLDPDFSCTHSLLPERDWNESWKASFIPIDVGERFTIIPSWMEHTTERIPIIIDPGMVFGTGHHETTRRCLMLIEEYADVVRGGRFLDIGTGSGILAIAAARIGFRHVCAVDLDPLSIDAARRNAEANGFPELLIREGTIENAAGTYDLIAANLISEVLTVIAPSLAARLDARGRAILSGMLKGQEDDVISSMAAAGLVVEETALDGQWISLVVRKQDSDMPDDHPA